MKARIGLTIEEASKYRDSRRQTQGRGYGSMRVRVRSVSDSEFTYFFSVDTPSYAIGK